MKHSFLLRSDPYVKFMWSFQIEVKANMFFTPSSLFVLSPLISITNTKIQ